MKKLLALMAVLSTATFAQSDYSTFNTAVTNEWGAAFTAIAAAIGVVGAGMIGLKGIRAGFQWIKSMIR